MSFSFFGSRLRTWRLHVAACIFTVGSALFFDSPFSTMSAIADAAAAQDSKALVMEYQVKAALVFNFAKLTKWPDGELKSEFVITFLGNDPLADALERLLGNKSAWGRPVAFRRVESIEQVKEAQILVVGESMRDNLRQIIQKLSGRNVLTISDIDDFTGKGGMIGFVMRSGNVRYLANENAISETKLRVDQELIKLAER